MPIYEYRCSSCSHELEALQKFSDPPLSRCPACGKDALTKLVSAAGFQLKGSGWYVTDFRNGSKPAAKSGDGKTDTKSDTKSEASTGASASGDAKSDGGSAKSDSTSGSTASTAATPASS